MKDHFAGAGKPMSDIDRIAKKWRVEMCAQDISISEAIRAALLEYGDIVREECAKKVEDQECDQTEYRCNTIERAAAAIRNAHQG